MGNTRSGRKRTIRTNYTKGTKMINEIRRTKLRYKTNEIIYSNGAKAIEHHNTDIVTFLPDGDIVLNSGGWYSKTTKERINDAIGQFGHIVQRDFTWYYCPNGSESDKIPYYDRMVINGQTGQVVA